MEKSLDLQIFWIISSQLVVSMVEIWKNLKFLTCHPFDGLTWNDP